MIDIEALLTPISDAAPAGDDLRMRPSDITFEKLAEHRTEVSSDEDFGGEGREANWPAAIRLCTEALTGESKDVELAVKLTEATTRIAGFDGLAEGLRLTRELLDKFWSQIHPGVDPDDGEIILPIRARSLTWLGSSDDFLRSVKECPVMSWENGPSFSWHHYQTCDLVDERQRQAEQEGYQDLIDAGFLGSEDWNGRIGSVDPTAIRGTLATIRGAQDELSQLRARCDELFSDEAPSFVGLGELLLEIREYLEDRLPEEVAAVELSADGAVDADGAPVQVVQQGGGPISGREDALRRLSEVADYFTRTEPHSPIAYMVQRTVRWGHMPLADLLEEIVKDDSVLANIWDTLGIQRGEQ
jgi:type VI secretion system protein ImpA